MRIKKRYLTLLARDIPFRKKLKVLEWNLRNHDLWGPFPLFAQIEVDSRCNLSCIMCNRRNFADGSYLTLDQFKEIIDKLGNTICHIVPYGFGESLLNKDFVPMMEYAKSKGILFSLTTNGTKILEHDFVRLLKLKLTYIQFSIDHSDPATYEEIRPGSNWDLIQRNFKYLVRERDLLYGNSRLRPKINITTSLRLDTIDQIPAMIDLKDQMKADYIRFRDMVWQYDTGPSTKNNSIKANLSEEEINKIIEPFKDRKDVIFHLGQPKQRTCIWPKDNLYINANGEITVCACGYEDFPILGNIFEMNSIMDIWNTEVWDEMRQGVIDAEGDYRFCQGCEGWSKDLSDV